MNVFFGSVEFFCRHYTTAGPAYDFKNIKFEDNQVLKPVVLPSYLL